MSGPRFLVAGRPVNTAAVLNRGLTAWWLVLPWTMSGSRWRDLTGNAGATFTNMGATTATSGWSATRRPGGWGAVRFDGTNDSARTGAPYSRFLTAAQGTIALWMRPIGSPVGATASYAMPAAVSDIAGGGFIAITYGIYTAQDRIWLMTWDGGERNVPIPYTLGEWVHIAWVHTGGTLTGYKNGVLSSSVTAGDTSDITHEVSFGEDLGTPRFFPGQLDDIRFYNVGLAASAIADLYQASRTGYREELIWQTWPPTMARPAGAPGAPKAPPPYQRPWRFMRRRRAA